MSNANRSPIIALVRKDASAKTVTTRGIDLSLPEEIQRALEPGLAQAGFRLEMKDTNPLGQDNIRFHRICGTSKSGPSSAALFYVNDERQRLPACTEIYFIYSLCIRVCKKFKTGDADSLSLVVLTPEGMSCPRTWEQQFRDFKDIRAVAAAECLSIPPPEQWTEAGADVAIEYARDWIRTLNLDPLPEAVQRTAPASTFGADLIGQVPNTDPPDVFISYSHADEAPCAELQIALQPLEQEHYKLWWDKIIEVGDKWEPAIARALAAARVVVFLCTQTFITSAFIRREELGPTLAAAENGQKIVCWVKWEQCAVETIGLKSIQAAHDIRTPLSQLLPGDRKAQLYKVYTNVKALLDKERRRLGKVPRQQPDSKLFGQ